MEYRYFLCIRFSENLVISSLYRIFAKNIIDMGIFLNLGNEAFRSTLEKEYVDKSGLIACVNSTLNSDLRYSCVSRCRRFGKSTAAKMLRAYYDSSCDSRDLFASLEIAKDPSFEKHLNKYPVIYVDMTNLTTRDIKRKEMLGTLQSNLMKEIRETYPGAPFYKDDDLMDMLVRVTGHYHFKFIMIIDEWDAICREFLDDSEEMDRYVNLLRRLFKGSNTEQVFAGVYMTGILPIKKYRTESALNNFLEYSMVSPGRMSKFFGFTKEETRVLAEKHGMDFDELVKWYDGYQIGAQKSMFNPNSVMRALENEWCESYWGKTGATDAVADYIHMNYEGLKDDIIDMLAGGRCDVNPGGFKNDLSQIFDRDDVLTVLIHLGYLSYDRVEQQCYIPNKEVAGEMEIAIKTNNWKNVIEAVRASKELLQATLQGKEEAVAEGIEAIHDESTSILSYNNENSLSCVISLAYYYARNNYIVHREYPSGKGLADLVLIPRKHVTTPAMIIELKKDKKAGVAIDQIKNRNYMAKVSEYADNLLLVGINYDTKTKSHTCKIERWNG